MKLESDLEFMNSNCSDQARSPARQNSIQVKYGIDRVGSSQADDDPPFDFRNGDAVKIELQSTRVWDNTSITEK